MRASSLARGRLTSAVATLLEAGCNYTLPAHRPGRRTADRGLRNCGVRPRQIAGSAGKAPDSGGLESGRIAQDQRPVGALPRELGLIASEMAVGRSLAVDRAQQVKHL